MRRPDQLQNDLELLGIVVPGAKQAHHEAQGATVFQATALSRGYEKVRAIRTAVRKAKAPDDVKKAYGVGQAMNRRIVRDVKAGLNQIIARAETSPAEAADIGIVPQDITTMKEMVVNITGAHKTQDEKQASAPQTTKQRNATANRILWAVGRIEGAGLIQFTDQPTVRESFESLGAGPNKGKKKDAATQNGEKQTSAAKQQSPAAQAQKPAAETQNPAVEPPVKPSTDTTNPSAEASNPALSG